MKLIIASIFMLSGVFFFGVGSVGLIRLPDLYSRTHSGTKCDTLGAALCIIAMMMYSLSLWVAIKLFIIIGFLWITNPTAAHLIGKSSLKAGLPAIEGTLEIDCTEVKRK